MSDPYNRDGPNEKTLEALERAWRACLADTADAPTEIWCTFDTWELIHGRRSVTFYPYGREAVA